MSGNGLEKLEPSSTQWNTIWWIVGYTISIGILWNVPYLKNILWPFKVFTVALHEFGHAFGAKITGGTVESITLDPDEGGLTKMRGGNPYVSLPAGYIGSCLWGSFMVFAGFSNTGSKVISVFVGLAMLATLWWARNWLARGVTIFSIGFIAFLWWLEGGKYLRYFVLFLGVMSSMYSLWDIVDDLISRKVNESDASQYSRICCGGAFGSRFWGVLWFFISVVVLAFSVAAALALLKTDS